MSNLPPYAPSPEAIGRQLSRGDLAPIRELLARLLAAEPESRALAEWATAYPDRWASMVVGIGRLSGIAERHELAVDIRDVADMSDAEIAERLRLAMQQVHASGQPAPIALPAPDETH